MYKDLDVNLLTRNALLLAGATVHAGDDGTEYALLRPNGERLGHYLLRLDGDAAAVVGATAPGVDPSRLLNGHLDGRVQAHAARFWAWLASREAEVSPTVADQLRAAGYEIYHTGGGCLAWRRPLDEEGDSYLLITAGNDIAGDPMAQEWDVGRYDGDSWINLKASFTLAEAIIAAAALPMPRGELVQEVYADLAAALAHNQTG